MQHQRHHRGAGFTALLLLLGLLLLGCDRLGRAPADLDLTPTAAPTATPTPLPEDAAPVEEAADTASAYQPMLDALLAEIPSTINAGAVQWRRDFNREPEPLLRVENGDGFKVYYTEQVGGQANLSFAVFDDEAAAAAHYERIRGIRSVLDTGQSNDTLPQPNLLGSGLYGSVGIFQVANYFLEVSIEVFSSTSGNPLVPLSRSAVEILQAGIARAENPDVKPDRIAALVSLVPDEIEAGGVTWRREDRNVTVLESGYGNGIAALTNYSNDEGATARAIWAVFDNAEDRSATYAEELARPRRDTLEMVLEGGDSTDALPQPNTLRSGQLVGSAVSLEVNDHYYMVVEMFAPSEQEWLAPLAEALLNTLNESISAFEAIAPSE